MERTDEQEDSVDEEEGEGEKAISAKKLKRQEKKKRRKQMEKELKKNRVDWSQSEDQILVRYKEIFPDVAEEKLKENIKYQKMIIDYTKKNKRSKKN